MATDMKKNQTPLKSQQWQLSIIYKLEALSDWLQVPKRKRLGVQVFNIFIVLFLLWGMFLVPSNILQSGGWPRALVSLTSLIFPWVTHTEQSFGASAGKFVFWQALSIWIFIIPLTLLSLIYREVRLKGKNTCIKYFQSASSQLKIAPVFFCLPILLNTLVFQPGKAGSKLSTLLVLNDYFCVLGASLCAVLTIGFLIEIVLAGIYLIHHRRSVT